MEWVKQNNKILAVIKVALHSNPQMESTMNFVAEWWKKSCLVKSDTGLHVVSVRIIRTGVKRRSVSASSKSPQKGPCLSQCAGFLSSKT